MLKTKSLVVSSFAFFFLGSLQSNQAMASTLSSSVGWTDPGSYQNCTVTNVSAKAIKNLKIEIIDNTGQVIIDKTVDVLDPNQTETLKTIDVVPAVSGWGFCKIKAPKTKVRATLNVYRFDRVGGYYNVLGTYPVQ